MATATCTHDGIETRLRCVTCEEPICPKCLVETKVGFKCPVHGRVTAAPGPARPAASRNDARSDRDQPGGGGRPGGSNRPGGGGRRMGLGGGMMGGFLIFFIAFPLIALGGFGLMALFAATADSTGIVALLPLIAVGVLLTGFAVWLAARLSRKV